MQHSTHVPNLQQFRRAQLPALLVKAFAPQLVDHGSALYYIAARQGFIRVSKDRKSFWYGNVRTASPFTSYEEADTFFKNVCSAGGDEFYAILSTPLFILKSTQQ